MQKNSNSTDTLPQENQDLAQFSELQRRAILDPAVIKQIIAGAGSGKTKTIIGLLTYRLTHCREKPECILVLSFSRKAVAELKERLPEKFRESIQVRTFHGFCLQQIKKIYPEKKISIIEPAAKTDFFVKKLHQYPEIGGIPFSLLIENPDIFQKQFSEIEKKINRAFARHKKRHDLLEFSELIDQFLHLLQGKERCPKVESIRQKFECIIVDEFQDTDPRQFDFLCQMKSKRIIVVGDDWQAIYAFRGATVKPFLLFQERLAAKVFFLKENYRSLKQIVDLGSKVISASKRQVAKKVKVVRRCSTKIPNFAIEINRKTIVEFLSLLTDNLPYALLVRSNQRRIFWEKKGIPKEKIMTIHRAKGLEFPIVFLDLCGGWGTISLHVDQEKQDFQDEEIRILYVGITRAQNLLTFLYLPVYRPRSRDGFFWQQLIVKQVRCIYQPPFPTLFKKKLSLAQKMNS